MINSIEQSSYFLKSEYFLCWSTHLPTIMVSEGPLESIHTISDVTVPYQCRPFSVRQKDVVKCIFNKAIHTSPVPC